MVAEGDVVVVVEEEGAAAGHKSLQVNVHAYVGSVNVKQTRMQGSVSRASLMINIVEFDAMYIPVSSIAQVDLYIQQKSEFIAQ